MRITVPSLLCGLALLAASPAHADKFLADGAFCDTSEAATDFVNAWDGHNAAQALDAVNKKAGKATCALTTVLIEEVERPADKQLTTATGKWQLVKVNVWGTKMGDMMLSYSFPLTQFTYIEAADPTKLGQAI